MHTIIKLLESEMQSIELSFAKKPILIDGMAMEYYGIRKSGSDIDFVVSDEDYQAFASMMPDKRKDIYGDLGIVIGAFEIWRSIALLDYNFYLKDAVEERNVFVISLDRLLLTRVNAMEAETHIPSYQKNHGIVFDGQYKDKNI